MRQTSLNICWCVVDAILYVCKKTTRNREKIERVSFLTNNILEKFLLLKLAHLQQQTNDNNKKVIIT